MLFGKEIHTLLQEHPHDVIDFIYRNAKQYCNGKEPANIFLSNPGKMPGYSFSLPAILTCGDAPKTQEKCQFCYACQGRYVFPGVIDSRIKNLNEIYKDPINTGFTLGLAIVKVSAKEPYFRFFDSGDVGNEKIAKAVTVACATALYLNDDVKIWIPTSQHLRIDILPWLKLLSHMGAVVRPSSSKFWENDPHVPDVPGLAAGSTITVKGDTNGKVYVCPAKNYGNSCGPCRHCWDNPDEPVAYVFHGGKVNQKYYFDKLKKRTKEVRSK